MSGIQEPQETTQFWRHPRFRDLGMLKAGEIRGSTMTWRWGNDEFSLNTDKRIGPGGGAYNLYVAHDVSFRPK